MKKENCLICKKEYPPTNNNQKYCSQCKIINKKQRKKEYNKKWKEINPNYQKNYYQKNKKLFKNYSNKYSKEYFKEYRKNNKEKIKAYKEKWIKKNPDYQKEYDKKYYLKHKKRLDKKHKKHHKKYYKKNKDKILKKQLKYCQKPEVKEKIRKRINRYKKNRYKTDKNFKLTYNLKKRAWFMLKKYTKTGKIMTSKEYGINYKAIIEHLKPFPRDLKGYEIHHIKPLHTFNFINKDSTTNLKEIKKAFAPENHKLLTIQKHKEIHNHLSLKRSYSNKQTDKRRSKKC